MTGIGNGRDFSRLTMARHRTVSGVFTELAQRGE